MEKIDQLIASIQDLVQTLRIADSRQLDARRIYTTQEAAKLFGVSVTTVHRMVQGGLKYRDVIGKGYLFLGSDILDFLDQNVESRVEPKRSHLRRVGT